MNTAYLKINLNDQNSHALYKKEAFLHVFAPDKGSRAIHSNYILYDVKYHKKDIFQYLQRRLCVYFGGT